MNECRNEGKDKEKNRIEDRVDRPERKVEERTQPLLTDSTVPYKQRS
jgi:hypothetical protein